MNTEHKLPPDLGEEYDAIHNDVSHLHAIWRIYTESFHIRGHHQRDEQALPIRCEDDSRLAS